ncbi:DUF4303 domain-containing protein [Kibdelosporangium phytohabitans]|uniref:DUF4303 domain-containing protein n=1 Tax=Kibdelosporangium phytohabitans TaxID=860235 RepID=A0A0N9IJ85_9PSEU|nr:DUF4303 domain-containing protein [Kibdelosporangium phytohabitans]ALG15156.1 hypothetical protein AOZ06_29530 [Kibdelosporangium phytohabitans]MBE1461570.1 hypothetical protein [Kibdelosporangium phytohabitans]
MTAPSEADLTDALTEAVRAAVTDLYRDHPGHTFCFVTLTTPGEAFGPALSAWSHEALAHRPDAGDVRYSYADSPFSIVGEVHLAPVRELFAARPEVFDIAADAASEAEFELRLRAIEAALGRLDAEGLFGTGEVRANVLVLAEVIPGDPGNIDRARRLNPPGPALDAWLASWTDDEN